MEGTGKKNSTGRNHSIVFLIDIIGIYLLFGLKGYMDETPKITPYKNVSCQAGAFQVSITATAPMLNPVRRRLV